VYATRFYTQIARAQLEYGVAISTFTSFNVIKLEDAQNKCIYGIFDGSSHSSTKVMLHLTSLSSMQERINILRARFFLRSLFLPNDTLLDKLLPFLEQSNS
jgi:hypothetical protein